MNMKGNGVLKALAERFPQLYVAPSEDAQEAHRYASLRGIAPKDANLDHFITNEQDELREVDTPAGPVQVLFLEERADFETFLQIIGHKAQPVPIARTVGAITYRGIPDWGAIAEAYAAYVAAGGDDWGSEFSHLAKQPGTFRAELVVISEGPYSNVSASETPYDEDEWLRVSREIRLHHECAHVVCRRLMPNDILPVWDEVTADFVGLLCATGGYDASLAARFLGTTQDGFAGGRLIEYLKEDQKSRVDEIATEVHVALGKLEALAQGEREPDAFALLLDLKREPLIDY